MRLAPPPSLPPTFPLPTVTLEDAAARQFRLLEATAAHFEGSSCSRPTRESSPASAGPGPPPASRRSSPTSSAPRTPPSSRARAPGRSGPRSTPSYGPATICSSTGPRSTAPPRSRSGASAYAPRRRTSTTVRRSTPRWRPGGSGGRTSSTPGSGSPTPTIRPRSSPPAGRPGSARSWTTTTPSCGPRRRGRTGRRRLLLLALQAPWARGRRTGRRCARPGRGRPPRQLLRRRAGPGPPGAGRPARPHPRSGPVGRAVPGGGGGRRPARRR